MKSLRQVRLEYEENYRKMIEVINRMGGDSRIKDHRKKRSPLYRKLRELQRREHYLNELETRLLSNQGVFH